MLSVFMGAGGRGWVDRLIAMQRPEHAPRIERALDRIATAIGNYAGGALLQALIAGATTYRVATAVELPAGVERAGVEIPPDGKRSPPPAFGL